MRSVFFPAAIWLAGALTVALSVMGYGAGALAPLLAVGTLYAVVRVPPCWPLLLAALLALTLENPSEAPAAGLWRSPLYPAGAVLLTHMNLTFPAHGWLIFSGLEALLLLVFVTAMGRRLLGSAPRHVGGAPGASPMRVFAFFALGGAAFVWAWGMARGGADVANSLWQVQRVIYLPLAYLLFEMVLRGRSDRRAAFEVLVAAACVKAALAIYLRATLVPRPGAGVIDYATSHADSMLFASAFCLVAALLLQRVDARRALLGAVVLPLLVAGMIANHRRVVWVELGAGLLTLLVLSPWTSFKRTLARAAVIGTPLVLVYTIVGWGQQARFFAPVEVVRSVVDSQADPSTAWRDWENYDLFYTLRQGPILGSGYGHGYIELVKLPDISQAYSLYRFAPHNSLLGLWAYGGLVGFFALWSLTVVGLFLAARVARIARESTDRATACAAAASIVAYVVHCYGDMALGSWTSVFTVGPALAVVSQLAVATGAWPRARTAIERPRGPAFGRHAASTPEPVIITAMPAGSAEAPS